MTDLPGSAACVKMEGWVIRKILPHNISQKSCNFCEISKKVCTRQAYFRDYSEQLSTDTFCENLRPCPLPTAQSPPPPILLPVYIHTGRYIGGHVHANHIWFSTGNLTQNCPGFEVKWHYIWGSMISTVTNSIQYQVRVSLLAEPCPVEKQLKSCSHIYV